MIYLPAIYDEHVWQRVDRLLLSDPILYAWLHWEIEYTKQHLGMELKVNRESVAWLTGRYARNFTTYPLV